MSPQTFLGLVRKKPKIVTSFCELCGEKFRHSDNIWGMPCLKCYEARRIKQDEMEENRQRIWKMERNRILKRAGI